MIDLGYVPLDACNALGIISSLLFIEQGYFGRHGSSHFRPRSKIKKSKFVLFIEHYLIHIDFFGETKQIFWY